MLNHICSVMVGILQKIHTYQLSPNFFPEETFWTLIMNTTIALPYDPFCGVTLGISLLQILKMALPGQRRVGTTSCQRVP